ncbi:MAG: aspartyl protease family protein, partial [Candidatus Eremiobacteraeota bacterium]|nr:aspartyl protease family protein [Candidatus Eremiobacteraeota bacterium]
KQTATWSFSDAPASVELTKETFPRILVDATINGVKGRFIFDTGAAGTLLSDSFARRAGAKHVGTAQFGGIGPSTTTANLFRVDTLTIGGSTLHDVIVSSGFPEEWTQREGVVGLIGFDLLGGAIVDLNLDQGTLRTLDPVKVQPNESQGYVVHIDLSDQHIRVPMKLNDRIDVMATLDSGNPLNVLFSRDLIFGEKLAFLVDPHDLGSTRYGGGLGGVEIEHCGRLTSLALGPIVYRPVPACDSESFARNDVLVGLDFMKNFNYVFDYPDGIIVMTPRK